MKIFVLESINLNGSDSSYDIWDIDNKRYLYKEISKNILYGVLGADNMNRWEFGQDTFDIGDKNIFINKD